MNESRGKILGLIFFVFLVFLLGFLIMNSKKDTKKKIGMIELVGNKLLSEKDYLSQSKLNNKKEYDNLTLRVVKDRIQKHPYVEKADVEYYSDNVVRISLTEKDMEAIFVNGSNPCFVSSKFELLPVMPKTKLGDLPVITNPDQSDKLKLFSYIRDNDVINGMEIIDAAKMEDNKFFKYLSEINLRNGGDIVLSLSGFKSPIIFGKGNVAEKIVYLQNVLDYLTANNSIANTSYVDLRFADNIYLGENQNTGLAQ
jgi:POTRA domain, FtsQ-type/Cell division protein FtsQ/DivIB, C-terminal